MHSTKLDLRVWISAMFLVLTSGKGISSVVMARLLGVNQKTAWKMGHAIREMMDDRNGELLPLEDIVEVNEAYVGGAPKSLSGAYNKRGKGTAKPMIFVAASRDGQARARVVFDDKRTTLEPVLLEWVDPATTSLMTDGSKSYIGLGKTMADHQSVIHSQKEYANPETGAHVNTAEALISQVQRALVGVYHNLGRQHLQRYLDEIVWRWNTVSPFGKWSSNGPREPALHERNRQQSGGRSQWLTRCASSYRARSASKSAARRNTAYVGRYADAFRSVGHTEHALLRSQRTECVIACGAPGLLPSCPKITTNIVSIMAKKTNKGHHNNP